MPQDSKYQWHGNQRMCAQLLHIAGKEDVNGWEEGRKRGLNEVEAYFDETTCLVCADNRKVWVRWFAKPERAVLCIQMVRPELLKWSDMEEM